ncbi:MAG TPA: aminodeoxychorismate synthase component I, partial [Pyrinomonadaceae bacterium]|nr:aminodeoxychorismate synthase component I [Pyrinomonadaceae bacterium]
LLTRARGTRTPRARRGHVLSVLDERLAERRVARAPGAPLPGGACFVTLSYGLARQLEKLRTRERGCDAAAEPDAVLAFFDVLVVHDYASEETRLVGVSAERVRETAASLRRSPGVGNDRARGEGGGEARFASNFSRAEYVAAVGRLREHIFAGDIYQANLTQQFTCRPSAAATPERVFLRLRREHPASFAAFVRRGRRGAIVSASPERFLRVGGGSVEAWPIKGTRPRGRTGEEDARLRAELLASEKDRAENVMIVDLMRNDLGRVCRYGSVEVTSLCELQEHPTLFHLVSKVRGRLREGVTAGELLRATFPCGSITGAPKIRAMEILDEVETAPRGVSMGAIGYFAFDGSADLNVAIRTITFGGDGAARFNVGGGVVADSDPEAEYEESLVKARALMRALRDGE